MKRAEQKLNSRRGASILLALVMLLVVTMISAVVISAAVTTANRVNNDHDHQQQMLAVNSAARLAIEAMKDARYTVTTQETITTVIIEVKDEGGNVIDTKEETSSETVVTKTPDPNSAEACISTMLLAPIQNRVASHFSIIDGPYYFTLSPADGTVDGLEISSAIVTFTLSPAGVGQYKVSGVVCLVDEIPVSPGASAQNYEDAIENSTTKIGFTGRLRNTNEGPTSSRHSDFVETFTTIEEWYFAGDTFELHTVGLEE